MTPGQDGPLEEGTATRGSGRSPGGGHGSPWVMTVPWRVKWQPAPVFLPGESHGQKILWATVCGVPKGWTQLSTDVDILLSQFPQSSFPVPCDG